MTDTSTCGKLHSAIWMVMLFLILLTVTETSRAIEDQDTLTNSQGMEFVFIPPGTFMMGSPDDEMQRGDNEVRHAVTITRGFYLQTTEVTQAQWKKLMGKNPSKNDGCPDCPVENISWFDAQSLIQKLNRLEKTNTYRLPTEAEWEYACRANKTTPFSVGEFLSTDQANYNGNHPIPGSPRGINRNQTVPVGSFPANPFGLHDMHGNVYEWCQDWYGPYAPNPAVDPVGPATGYSRVSRGGGLSSYARRCRCANRTKHLPGYTSFYIGLRLAKTR